MACGLIQQAVIHHAPGFVKYYMKEEAIHIRPEDKTEKGLHKILIELLVNSKKSFHVLNILVKLPLSYIDSRLMPVFNPSLRDD